MARERSKAYRDAIVRIGDNAYKVSHHKLIKRPLPTTVQLPPIASDPKVSEFVFGPKSRKSKSSKKHSPNIATSVDFEEQFPRGRIRDFTKWSRREIFTWDLAATQPKPTWRYLTRGAVSFSPDKPLPSINNSIHQIGLRARERKIGAEIAKFCSNLSEGTLSRFEEWHEKMIRMDDDCLVPPNSIAQTLKKDILSSSSDDEPLKWKKPKQDELSSTLYESSDDTDALEDENQSRDEDEAEVPEDKLNLIRQKVNLVATYVPEDYGDDFPSPTDRKLIVWKWLDDNFEEPFDLQIEDDFE